MLEWMSVALLIVVGIILLTVEVIFVPGTTIIGIIGIVCLAIGVFLGFEYFGDTVGWSILIVSTIAGGVALIIGLRGGVWEKFANKSSIDSKFNEDFAVDLQVGQVGKSISALRPIGKGEFDSQLVEVRSNGNYIANGLKIQVTRIEENKIYVEAYEPKTKG